MRLTISLVYSLILDKQDKLIFLIKNHTPSQCLIKIKN